MRWERSWAGEARPAAFSGGFHGWIRELRWMRLLDPPVSLCPLCRQQAQGCAQSGISGRWGFL